MNLEKIHVCAFLGEERYIKTENRIGRLLLIGKGLVQLGLKVCNGGGKKGVICGSKIIGMRIRNNIGYTILKNYCWGVAMLLIKTEIRLLIKITLIKRLYKDFPYRNLDSNHCIKYIC